jgi:hypothetical protein
VQSYNLAVILQKETGKSMKKRVKKDILKGRCPILKGYCPYAQTYAGAMTQERKSSCVMV